MKRANITFIKLLFTLIVALLTHTVAVCAQNNIDCPDPLVVDLVPNGGGDLGLPQAECSVFCSLNTSMINTSLSNTCSLPYGESFVIQVREGLERPGRETWMRILVSFTRPNDFSLYTFEGADSNFELVVPEYTSNTLQILENGALVASIYFDGCHYSFSSTLYPGYELKLTAYCPPNPPSGPSAPFPGGNGLSAATSPSQAAQAPIESRNDLVFREHPLISAVNPVSDFIRLQAARAPASPIAVEVIGADGRRWERAIWPAGATQLELPAAALPPGLYALRLHINGQVQVLKLIKS